MTSHKETFVINQSHVGINNPDDDFEDIEDLIDDDMDDDVEDEVENEGLSIPVLNFDDPIEAAEQRRRLAKQPRSSTENAEAYDDDGLPLPSMTFENPLTRRPKP